MPYNSSANGSLPWVGAGLTCRPAEAVIQKKIKRGKKRWTSPKAYATMATRAEMPCCKGVVKSFENAMCVFPEWGHKFSKVVPSVENVL